MFHISIVRYLYTIPFMNLEILPPISYLPPTITSNIRLPQVSSHFSKITYNNHLLSPTFHLPSITSNNTKMPPPITHLPPIILKIASPIFHFHLIISMITPFLYQVSTQLPPIISNNSQPHQVIAHLSQTPPMTTPFSTKFPLMSNHLQQF